MRWRCCPPPSPSVTNIVNRAEEARDTEGVYQQGAFGTAEEMESKAAALVVVQRFIRPYIEEQHNLMLRLRFLEMERDYPDAAAVMARVQELVKEIAEIVNGEMGAVHFFDADGEERDSEAALREILRFARKKEHL